MTIAAFLWVKDERELLEGTINHLFKIGVDRIVACDVESADGSLEILSRFVTNDAVRVISFRESDFDDVERWVEDERRMVQSTGADWSIFLDADERWIPKTGNLKDCVPEDESGVLRVARYNVVLGENGLYFPQVISDDTLDKMLLYTKSDSEFRTKLMKNDTIWSKGVPMPKVMARTSLIHRIHTGHHHVDLTGDQKVHQANDLFIAHLPFTSLSRFRKKVKNVRLTLAINAQYYPKDSAWHWKRWAAIASESEIASEYESQICSSAMVEQLRNASVIQSAKEIFSLEDAF